MTDTSNLIHLDAGQNKTYTGRQLLGNVVYDNDGGEPPMDKYVTHSELEANNEKILHQMDNHFADLRQELNREFRSIDQRFNEMGQKFDQRFNDIDKKFDQRFNKMDQKFDYKLSEMKAESDQRFNEMDKRLSNVENTASSNKRTLNWLLYTVIGGSLLSIVTTIITNLITH